MIYLINPPNLPDAVSNKDMMGGFGQLYGADSPIKVPPIDLAYIAALLKKEKIEFNVFECLGRNWGLGNLLENIKDTKPDLIGIRTSTPTFEWDLKIANSLKHEVKSKIIFFGPHVGIYANEVIAYSSIDGIILGEPEFTFLEIAKKGFENAEGVWFKRDGVVIKNQGRGFIEDLDSLPFPDWKMLPYKEYNLGKYLRNIKPCVTVLTSRGCPFDCGYCPYPVSQGKKWRARSVANVINELEYLEKTLGIKSVLFRDPEFTLRRERVVDICNAMIDKGLSIKWRCETRVDTLDEELINLFAKAGCIGINVGVESVDAEVLKKIGRKVFPLKMAAQIINACKNNDIDAFAFFMLGLPGETIDSSLKTIKYAKKLNPHLVQFTVATPYKGTKLWKWAKERGFIDELNLGKVNGFNIIMGNEDVSKEKLRDLVKYAYSYFNSITLKEAILKNFRPFNFLRDLREMITLRKQEKDILSK